jgi:hypothetical protein
MQTLAEQIAIIFVDDATAFITGCGRIVARMVMAPIDRLANACDVAGVLPQRRSSLQMRQVEPKRARRGSSERTSRSRRGRWSLGNRMFTLRCLNDLT